MAYDLVFQERDGFLQVEVTGDRTVGDPHKDSKASWAAIAGACEQGGFERILVISSVTGPYTTAAAHATSSSLTELGILRNWKVAFVNLVPAVWADIRFAETVAINQGVRIKAFGNEGLARQWLLSAEPR